MLATRAVSSLGVTSMAFQMSAQLSHIRALTSTALVPRARAHYHSVGVKFKHFVTPGSLLPPKRPLHASAGAGTNFPASLTRGHIHSASRVRQLSTARVTFWRSGPGAGSSPRGKRGLLGRIAFGALGVTAAAVVSLHTGTLVAMAHKPNLDSAGGDWKETKGEPVQPGRTGLWCVLCRHSTLCVKP